MDRRRVPLMFAATVLVVGGGLCYASLAARAERTFGFKEPGLYNLKGVLYALPDGTNEYPKDLDKLEQIGVIYVDSLDVPQHKFTGGFPDVTDRTEWFGIVYTGLFNVEKPGSYRWRLSSDDGSRLWIDGKEVIDNDGVHGTSDEEDSLDLTVGAHDLKVWYFQGLGEASLQLFVKPPDGEERIFLFEKFSPGLRSAIEKVEAVATPDGIRVRLEADILFEPNTADLRPASKDLVASIRTIIAAYPSSTVKVSAFSDSSGDEKANVRLTDDRAAALKEALRAVRLPAGVTLESRGYGRSRPIGSNTTEQGRAKNRRAEVIIKP